MSSFYFFITVDNTQNTYDIILNSISEQYGNFTPALVTGTTGIAAGKVAEFAINGDDFDNSGANLTWITGPANDPVTVQMNFLNYAGDLEDDNEATLSVTGSDTAMMAYGGTSFLTASGGSGTLSMRDYVPDTIDGTVYLTYSIVRNSYVDNPQTSYLPGITNVVMLMLENRSLDHLLGQLYTENNLPPVVYPAKSPAEYAGLGATPTFSNTDSNNNPPVTAYAIELSNGEIPTVPETDPGEVWADVNQQLFNSTTAVSGDANMGGFLNNYEAQTSSNTKEIMGFYTSGASGDLPVLSGLAASYGISDAWFCSVPSQTYTNRAFSLAGASEGCADNWDFTPFQLRTIFNVLSDSNNNNWAIYYQDEWMDKTNIPYTAYQFSAIRTDPMVNEGNIQPFSNFLSAAEAGTLPAFSYLEPAWYGFNSDGIPWKDNGNDYHPPGNVGPGEVMLNQVYNALTSNAEAWATTLFIVTFDEHGGTFDHVPPPATIAPDDQVSSEGFGFNRLGIRIPTLLISPFIQKGTVFRSPSFNDSTGYIPFDHTSFIKTILGWSGIDVSGGMMGARAAQAPDFSGVLSSSAVNSGAYTFTPNAVSDEAKKALNERPLNDLQKAVAEALAHNIAGGKPGNEEHLGILNELRSMRTVNELKEYVAKINAARTKT